MIKENVEMIKEMRRVVMYNLKYNNLDDATIRAAEFVTMYDHSEEKYEKNNNVTFKMPNIEEYKELLEKMKNDSSFEKLIRSMSIDVDSAKAKPID